MSQRAHRSGMVPPAVLAAVRGLFPNGPFICQDGPNDAPGSSGNLNVTSVPFQRIAAA